MLLSLRKASSHSTALPRFVLSLSLCAVFLCSQTTGLIQRPIIVGEPARVKLASIKQRLVASSHVTDTACSPCTVSH